VLDAIRHAEPGFDFGELTGEQPFRLIAFRALVRDYPTRDPTSMWLHTYDVELDIVEDDPFLPPAPTQSPPSADTGVASPEMSSN
jgi:hypothetical protein